MKNVILFLIMFFWIAIQAGAQVGINLDNSLPHPSAGLDVKFTDRGFLPPRLTYAQIFAISDPAAGLIIYCTDCQPNGSLLVYSGGGWNTMTTGCLIPGATTPGVHVASPTQIVWNWNTVPGSTGYKWNSKNQYSSATDLGTATTLTQTGLFCDNNYAIYVWAYNACGVSPSVNMTKPTTMCCDEPITDPRDGKVYTTVLIGSQCWFKENLNYGTQISGAGGSDQTNNGIPEKYCFNNDGANCTTRGGLYQWAELVQYLNGATNTALWNPAPTGDVQGMCPDGWHLPSAAEYDLLMTSQGGMSLAGGPLKETGTTYWQTPNTGATNTSHFSAKSTGMRRSDGLMNLTAFPQNGFLWSASPDLAGSLPNEWSFNYKLVYNSTTVTKTGTTKANAFAARCIKNTVTFGSLLAPTAGTHVPSQDQIVWNWNTVAGATGYKWSAVNNYSTATDMGTATTKTQTGLTCGTPYTSYAWAYDAGGASASVMLEQTTSPCGTFATLTTTAASGITSNSALSGGNITSDGGTPVTARGVCWSQYANPTVADSHTTDGTGTGIFVSSLNDLTPNATYYIRAYATNSVGTAYGNEVTFTTLAGTFIAGQYYQGGIIFYVDPSGLHGLIAATSNQGAPSWGVGSVPGTSTAIGTGQANTTAIVTAINTPGIAARVCDDLVLNGYSDWFLPSKNELYEMYLRKSLIGAFPSIHYWSSSEYSTGEAWVQNFDNGTQIYVVKSPSTAWVRPVRAF
jgi:uncharacterized protein (TIGR02145 family)